MSQTEQQQPTTPVNHDAAPRPARSKNGCNACRRRKVRCNERRPRCGHCERLNLDCTWNRPPPSRAPQAAAHPAGALGAGFHSNAGFGNFVLDSNAFFDFAGPLGMGTWDEAMLLSPNSWPTDPSFMSTSATAAPLDLAARPPHQTSFEDRQSSGTGARSEPSGTWRPSGTFSELGASRVRPEPASTSPFSSESATQPGHVDEEFLINTFLQMLMPPILTPVEIGPKWASTRAFFGTMAGESPVVRSAIAAFAAMQIQRSGMDSTLKADWRPLYDTAARQLSGALTKKKANNAEPGKEWLKHVLASLFLLTYTDLLTETLPRAHANLGEAYNLIQNSEKNAFTVPEKRLISWLRLLDARAVSTAGGEGLFLADTDESLFDASPAAHSGSEPIETLDTEIEEILFDVLYHPGIVFYQKVQSFVGRITRIDPWHRSRGTVQDETEVMALAAQISTDLHALYGQRPALMDHAAAGNLTEKHLAKNLAGALTSFRAYLANYYASFLHLHRVAYVQYPKTKDINSAIANIKRLSHYMAETDESLPVNLLWPLLMWGCEEESLEERRWILESIRGLESIATNAKSTADLLEEVQRRQDEGKRRVDVRSVSQEYFASHHFAIV
ncbi:fungal-specific transcription factor domain-containing protein [Lophiotrema nucula]|uniref:Fungal-specific transcription factor domain-containing protein n=1 Tax=Lophiotrema nucula TaxID=690887 RepID=A0A6A5Z3Z8_9PLEO|nr:fungal-specific transcription factor domain-containing protein [Lophiotrema nucula]